jgi:hypothetical protein
MYIPAVKPGWDWSMPDYTSGRARQTRRLFAFLTIAANDFARLIPAKATPTL